ncbi:hypothetical protein [Streptomyces sp. NPDC088726]
MSAARSPGFSGPQGYQPPFGADLLVGVSTAAGVRQQADAERFG